MSDPIVRSEVDLSTLQLPDQSFSLAEFRQTIYRQWKPALTVGITAFTTIFLLVALQTPKYRSETLILLKDPQDKSAKSVAPNQDLAAIVNRYRSATDLSTEIVILGSNSLVNKAIVKLKTRYPDLTLKEVKNNLLIYQIAIDEKIPTDVVVASYTDPDPEKAKAILDALDSVYIEYSLQKQRLQARNAIEFIDEQLPAAQKELEEAAQKIRHFRQVHQLVDPEISAITAGENREEIALEIQQTKIAIDLNRQQSQELEQQLKELGQDSETMLASSVLSEDGVYQNLASQLRELETQYNLGKVDFHEDFYVLDSLREKRQELKKLLQERAEQVLGKSISPQVLERIVATPSYTDIQSPVQNNSVATEPSSSTSRGSSSDSGDRASQTGQTTKLSGSGTRVSSEGSTLGLLAARKLELENEAATLQSQLGSLRREKAKAESDFVSIPSLQQTFTELKRQLELKSQAYNYLLEKRQELKISEAEEIAPWRILNEPFLPDKPVSPNIQLGLFQAATAGIFLAIATAFILQRLDQSITQVEEIKHITRLPLLGVVPKVSEPRIDANVHTTRQSYSYYSSFAEGLRSLAMNLRYLFVNEGQVKTLAITSSTSAEGKSTISYNLGIVLAELGLQVLVVDGDLRKPKIHKLAQIKNETGLSEVITTDNPWTDYIKPSSTENLSLITAGASSPNPIALLNSDKMKQLIKAWQESYDYVIIDTPPVGVIADTKSLANKVDSILFIAGIQRVSRKSINNAIDILSQSQCNLSGVVANLVDPSFDYYAYSYYDHYYNQSHQERDEPYNSDRSRRKRGILEQFRRR